MTAWWANMAQSRKLGVCYLGFVTIEPVFLLWIYVLP